MGKFPLFQMSWSAPAPRFLAGEQVKTALPIVKECRGFFGPDRAVELLHLPQGTKARSMIVKGRRKEIQRPVKVCGLIQQQWACASGRRGDRYRTSRYPLRQDSHHRRVERAPSQAGVPPGSPKHACAEMFDPAPACGIVNRSGMALQLYAIYARCNHCGIYDRNPQWCVLCGRAKDGSAGTAPVPPVRLEAKRTAPKSRPAKKSGLSRAPGPRRKP